MSNGLCGFSGHPEYVKKVILILSPFSLFRLHQQPSTLSREDFTMKLNRFQKILPLALLTAVAAEPALAAAGTQSVTNFFNTIEGTLQTVSLVVVTISVMWAGFRVLFMGNAFQEVAKPLLGGIMIGSAGWIASLFVG